MVLSVIFSI